MLAAGAGASDCAQLLLTAKADASLVDSFYATALYRATAAGYGDIVRIIEEFSSPSDAQEHRHVRDQLEHPRLH